MLWTALLQAKQLFLLLLRLGFWHFPQQFESFIISHHEACLLLQHSELLHFCEWKIWEQQLLLLLQLMSVHNAIKMQKIAQTRDYCIIGKSCWRGTISLPLELILMFQVSSLFFPHCDIVEVDLFIGMHNIEKWGNS